MKNITMFINQLIKHLILFLIGGIVYIGIEILWRGHSHWTMGIVGGLCFVAIGLINEFFTYQMYIEIQALISSVIITILEFISGLIINIHFKLDVWDYSNLPFNILGQVCLLFMILWFFLSFVGIVLDDVLRTVGFDEERPVYKSWFVNIIKKYTSKNNMKV